MDEEAGAALPVVVVGLVAVQRELREHGDQLDALAEHVLQAVILRFVVVRVEREHAAGHGIHDVRAGRLHDNIAHERIRQAAVAAEQFPEHLQFLPVRQRAEQQEISDLLEPVAPVLPESAHQVPYIVTPVPELAAGGLPVRVLALHLTDLGQAGQHAVAVQVPQAAVHLVPVVQLPVDHPVLRDALHQRPDLRSDLRIVPFCHDTVSSPVLFLSRFLSLQNTLARYCIITV